MSNEALNKINPEIIGKVKYTQGDGSRGTVCALEAGPGLQKFLKQSTYKIVNVEPGLSVTYQVIGGDLTRMYDPIRVTVTFIPVSGNEEEQCTIEWKAEFKKLSPSIPPPEKLKDAGLQLLKSAEKFVLEMVAKVEYTEGNGCTGTVCKLKAGPVTRGVLVDTVYEIDEVEPGRCTKYRVTGGDFKSMYDPFLVTITFSPVSGNEKEQCTVEWKAEFTKTSSSIPPPEELKDAAVKFFKSAEKFAHGNLVPN